MFLRTFTTLAAIAVLPVQGCRGDTRGSARTTPRDDHSDEKHTGKLVESQPDPTQSLAAVCSNGDCSTADQKFEYKGRTIVVNEQVDPPKVTIDGKPIAVQVHLGNPKAYAAAFQSYADYSSLVVLAKALVDSGMLGPPDERPAH